MKPTKIFLHIPPWKQKQIILSLLHTKLPYQVSYILNIKLQTTRSSQSTSCPLRLPLTAYQFLCMLSFSCTSGTHTIDAFHCLHPVSWQAYLDCIVKLLKLEAQSKGTNPNQDLRRAWIGERAQCGGTVLNLLCPVGGKFTCHHSERIPVPLLECTLLRWQHQKCTTLFQFEKHSQLWQVIRPSDRFLMAWLETTP